MARSFDLENTATRNELNSIVDGISDADLELNSPEGWSIAVILAHMAFWDQWSLAVLRRWQAAGVKNVDVDIDPVNDALLPFFRSIAPRTAADLAIAAAEEVDRAIEILPDEVIEAIKSIGDDWRYNRFRHRRMHIQQIQDILQGSDRQI